MERFLWKGHIYKGKVDEYIEMHDEIWPEMKDMILRAGIRNYSIWNYGQEVIGYYEFEDKEQKDRIFEECIEVFEHWKREMKPIMHMDMDENGQNSECRQVFLLDKEQKGDKKT